MGANPCLTSDRNRTFLDGATVPSVQGHVLTGNESVCQTNLASPSAPDQVAVRIPGPFPWLAHRLEGPIVSQSPPVRQGRRSLHSSLVLRCFLSADSELRHIRLFCHLEKPTPRGLVDLAKTGRFRLRILERPCVLATIRPSSGEHRRPRSVKLPGGHPGRRLRAHEPRAARLPGEPICLGTAGFGPTVAVPTRLKLPVDPKPNPD